MADEKVTVVEKEDESFDNKKVDKYFKIVVAVGIAALAIVGILAFVFLSGTDNEKQAVNVAAISGDAAFKETCGKCHTAYGIGQGNINLAVRLKGLPAIEIIKKVAQQPQMKDVSKQTITAITAFLSENALYGSIEFDQNCGKCHKAFGQGAGQIDITPAVKDMNLAEVTTHLQAKHKESAITKNPQIAKITAFLSGSGKPEQKQ